MTASSQAPSGEPKKPLQAVGSKEFGAFLSGEMDCESGNCLWQWYEGGSVSCDTCGSGFPALACHYLRRIWALTRERLALLAERQQNLAGGQP